MPEVRRSSRLPRPGEIEARQSALDNLRSKLAPEQARMLHMMAQLGLGAPPVMRIGQIFQ